MDQPVSFEEPIDERRRSLANGVSCSRVPPERKPSRLPSATCVEQAGEVTGLHGMSDATYATSAKRMAESG